MMYAVAEEVVNETEAPDFSSATTNRSRVVLVVEDDLLAGSAIQSMLKYMGHQVVLVGTVQEALSLLKTDRFDHILLDLMLPDGEGTDVLRHVRAFKLPARVVVASATNDDRLLARVKQLGPDHILRKPTDMSSILMAMGLQP